MSRKDGTLRYSGCGCRDYENITCNSLHVFAGTPRKVAGGRSTASTHKSHCHYSCKCDQNDPALLISPRWSNSIIHVYANNVRHLRLDARPKITAAPESSHFTNSISTRLSRVPSSIPPVKSTIIVSFLTPFILRFKGTDG